MLDVYVCAPVAVDGRPEVMLAPLPKDAVVGLFAAIPPLDCSEEDAPEYPPAPVAVLGLAFCKLCPCACLDDDEDGKVDEEPTIAGAAALPIELTLRWSEPSAVPGLDEADEEVFHTLPRAEPGVRPRAALRPKP